MDSKFSSLLFINCLLEVAPEAMVGVLVVDHRLQFSSSSLLVEFFLKIVFLSGARPALPMGVAPESMFGCL
jgi:hypothetical protein